MINDSLDGFRAKVYCNEKIYDMKSKKERHRTFSICRNPYTGFLMLSSSYDGQNKHGHLISNEKYNKICKVFVPREAH